MMIHARDDYNRIQDPEGLIPEDEPVMLFRAQDKYFTAVLAYYGCLLANDPQIDRKMLSAVNEQIAHGVSWSIGHGVKTPDMP